MNETPNHPPQPPTTRERYQRIRDELEHIENQAIHASRMMHRLPRPDNTHTDAWTESISHAHALADMLETTARMAIGYLTDAEMFANIMETEEQ